MFTDPSERNKVRAAIYRAVSVYGGSFSDLAEDDIMHQISEDVLRSVELELTGSTDVDPAEEDYTWLMS